MRIHAVCICVAVLVSAAVSPHLFAEPCSGYSFTPIFCDDFEEYCSPPPAQGQDCAAGSTADNDAFRAVWPADGTCEATSLENFLATGTDVQGVFGAQCVQRGERAEEGYNYIYRHVHDLTPDIIAHPANTGNADAIDGAGPIDVPLNGNSVPPEYVDSMSSTLRPEALKGTFYLHPLADPTQWGKAALANMIYYHELFLNDDRAPTDYTVMECPFPNDCNCNHLHPGNKACATGEQSTCDGGVHDGQTCSTDDQCTGTNRPILQRTDNQTHASFAVGLMSIYDTNPCDLDQGWAPSEWRLVVYDGFAWQTFKAPLFDIPLTSPVDIMDLYPLYGWNRIDFAIGADYIEVRLTNIQSQALHSGVGACIFGTCKGGANNNQSCTSDADCAAGDPLIPNEYLVARVPRQYKGPFNKYAIGPGKGRDLTDPQNPGAEQCLPAFSTADIISDEIVLYDGTFVALSGACCLAGDCSISTRNACETAGGVFHGFESACEEIICCPEPFADSDRDGDVDQSDFAVFQACFTGPGGTLSGNVCTCLDRTDSSGEGPPDNAIDASDWNKFEACASGAGIPADVDCGG